MNNSIFHKFDQQLGQLRRSWPYPFISFQYIIYSYKTRGHNSYWEQQQMLAWNYLTARASFLLFQNLVIIRGCHLKPPLFQILLVIIATFDSWYVWCVTLSNFGADQRTSVWPLGFRVPSILVFLKKLYVLLLQISLHLCLSFTFTIGTVNLWVNCALTP